MSAFDASAELADPAPGVLREDPTRFQLREFHTSGGYSLRYAELGAPAGYPVLALHGTPGSHLKYAAAHHLALATGLRLISPDRWGYGTSGLPRRPSLAGFAADMEAMADALGLASLSIVGVSGGGPFAVATAALMGRRVDRLALVSPVGQLEKLDAKHLRAFHRFCFQILPAIPGGLTAAFLLYRWLLLKAPRLAALVASLGAVSVDRTLMRDPQIGARLAETFKAGLARHTKGPVCDLRIFTAPWDIDPGRIAARTCVWLGVEDRNVPQAGARFLARDIPGAELVLLTGHGHYWITRAYGEVLCWLASR